MKKIGFGLWGFWALGLLGFGLWNKKRKKNKAVEKMSERYWITGVQLGWLVAVPDAKRRKDFVEDIIEKQFIGTKEDLENLLEKQGDGKGNE